MGLLNPRKRDLCSSWQESGRRAAGCHTQPLPSSWHSSCSGSGVSIRRDSPLLTLAQHPMGPDWQGLGGLSAVYEKTKQVGDHTKTYVRRLHAKLKTGLKSRVSSRYWLRPRLPSPPAFFPIYDTPGVFIQTACTYGFASAACIMPTQCFSVQCRCLVQGHLPSSCLHTPSSPLLLKAALQQQPFAVCHVTTALTDGCAVPPQPAPSLLPSALSFRLAEPALTRG